MSLSFLSLVSRKMDTNVELILPLKQPRQAISKNTMSANLKLSDNVVRTKGKAKLPGMGFLTPIENDTYFQLFFRQYYGDYF